jgi:hypothetical protein
MAQTVSTAKFSTSVTFNGSTNTLFTAPSGTACRVILNAMNFYINEGAIAIPYFYFMINNGTTGAIVMGYLNRPDNPTGTIDAFGIFPGNMSGPTSVGVGTNGVVPGGVVVSNNGAASTPLASRNPNGSLFGVSSNGSQGTFFPSQFWMCAGDTFQLSGTWGNRTGLIQGSMTLITES